MSLKDTTSDGAPPITGQKTINIEEAEYSYLITQLEKEEGILIKLSEVNPSKNITFTYQSTTEQLKKKIKAILMCENVEEIINSLNDIFNSGKINIEKKNEKYIMNIEASIFGKKK